MNKQQLKQQLHKEIDAIEDENALHMLNEAAVEYKRSKGKNFLISHDFSDVEDDENAFEIIKNIAATAGRNAAAEAKALGIPRVYEKNNKLIKISAKGDISPVIPKVKRSSYYVQYKSSTVLHAVKK